MADRKRLAHHHRAYGGYEREGQPAASHRAQILDHDCARRAQNARRIAPPDDAYGLRPPGSHRVAFFDGAFGGSARVSLGAVVVKHEKADHRGKVVMFAIDVDG